MTMWDVADYLQRFAQLHPKKIDLSLGRMHHILSSLSDPQLKAPQVVHVAGTNGKGSTTSLLRAILENHGQHVHSYTSPHLIRFNERIRISGKLINDAQLISCLDAVMKANANNPLTFFEATTAAAFLAFSKTPADYWLIEVGLGGQFDATNIFNQKSLALLTPINLDHQEFLGSNLNQIAREKAGIILNKTAVLSAIQPPECKDEIALQAKKMQSNLQFIEPLLEDSAEAMCLNLNGDHQLQNAALALAAARQLLGKNFDSVQTQKALSKISWPGRLTTLTKSQKKQLGLSDMGKVMIDGGHNAHAAAALVNYLKQMRDSAEGNLKITALIAMQKNKDAQSFIQQLAPHVDDFITTSLPEDHLGHDPNDLRDWVTATSGKGIATRSIDQALTEASQLSGPGNRHLMILGSLYLAGEILEKSGYIID